MTGLKTIATRLIGRALVRTSLRLGVVPRRPVRRGGLVVDLSHPDVSDDVRVSLFLGMYEGSERRAVRRFLKGGLGTIELGASIGVVTCLIAQKVARVVAVEADARLLAVTRHHLRLNGLAGVFLEHAVVAYESGPSAPFVAGRSTTTGRLWDGRSGGERRDVPVVTLGQLVDRYSFRPYALVCDIEGEEAALIAHERQDVLDACELAIVELHETTHDGCAVTPATLAERFATRTAMRVLSHDSKVWVFAR